MSAMMPLMWGLVQCGRFIPCIKHGVGMAGSDSGGMMPPLAPLDAAEQDRLAQVGQALKAAVAALGQEDKCGAACQIQNLISAIGGYGHAI